MRYRNVAFVFLLGLCGLAVVLLGDRSAQAVSPSAPATPTPTPTFIVQALVVNTTSNPVPVAPQGTQNVNIVGGGAGISVASKSFNLATTVSGSDNFYDVTFNGISTTINTSLITLLASNNLEIESLGPGIDFTVPGLSSGYWQVFTFPQRIPISRLHMTCAGGNCSFRINLVGD